MPFIHVNGVSLLCLILDQAIFFECDRHSYLYTTTLTKKATLFTRIYLTLFQNEMSNNGNATVLWQIRQNDYPVTRRACE